MFSIRLRGPFSKKVLEPRGFIFLLPYLVQCCAIPAPLVPVGRLSLEHSLMVNWGGSKLSLRSRDVSLNKLQPFIGFEPTTYALPWRHSTAELKGLIWQCFFTYIVDYEKEILMSILSIFFILLYLSAFGPERCYGSKIKIMKNKRRIDEPRESLGRAGFEPAQALPTDLQSVTINHSVIDPLLEKRLVERWSF